jgi:hypothetical protein
MTLLEQILADITEGVQITSVILALIKAVDSAFGGVTPAAVKDDLVAKFKA